MSDQIFNDLPDILDASQIASALRISRAGAYNLLSSEDFPYAAHRQTQAGHEE